MNLQAPGDLRYHAIPGYLLSSLSNCLLPSCMSDIIELQHQTANSLQNHLKPPQTPASQLPSAYHLIHRHPTPSLLLSTTTMTDHRLAAALVFRAQVECTPHPARSLQNIAAEMGYFASGELRCIVPAFSLRLAQREMFLEEVLIISCMSIWQLHRCYEGTYTHLYGPYPG